LEFESKLIGGGNVSSFSGKRVNGTEVDDVARTASCVDRFERFRGGWPDELGGGWQDGTEAEIPLGKGLGTMEPGDVKPLEAAG
jgi:hypothetical protein